MSIEFTNLVDKESLRAWVRKQSVPSVSFSSDHICKFIKEFTKPGDLWGAFNSIKNEPSVDWSKISELGLNLCFPRVTPEGLQFFSSDSFELGSFNILEPTSSSNPLEISSIKGFFVPGLVFDNRGQRLGRGKAFYDQLLKHESGLKVGVTWSKFFIHGSIPNDDWDVPMDFILTENYIYQPINAERLTYTEF